MKASTSVVLRALVMLTCLIAVPLAAVFGTSLPKMVKAAINGRWAMSSSAESPRSNDEAHFEPIGPVQTAGEPRTPSWPGEPTQNASSPPRDRDESRRPVVAAGFETPMPPASSSAAAGIPRGGPIRGDFERPPTPPALPNHNGDMFAQIQARLRQLGATYYLLESWGDQQQLYRFYCKVAVGQDPHFTKYFEATDPDCLRAMQAVLQQVEAWRGLRQQ